MPHPADSLTVGLSKRRNVDPVFFQFLIQSTFTDPQQRCGVGLDIAGLPECLQDHLFFDVGQGFIEGGFGVRGQKCLICYFYLHFS